MAAVKAECVYGDETAEKEAMKVQRDKKVQFRLAALQKTMEECFRKTLGTTESEGKKTDFLVARLCF